MRTSPVAEGSPENERHDGPDCQGPESDYLNGEVVLLGRLHGVPTPVNALLQRLANELARTGAPPGSVPAETFFSLLG